jgi:hypothetical protein
MKKILTLSLLLLTFTVLRAANADSTATRKPFMQKNSLGLGVQGVYFNMNSSDSQAFQLLTGISGKVSFMRIAPSFSWCYHRNQMLGIRFSYTWAELQVQNASVNLPMEGLDLNISDVGGVLNRFGGALFHRSYFGIDRRGICAIYADVAFTYSNARVAAAPNNNDLRSIALVFSPGFEVFVMNRLSLNFELGLAKIGYNFARNYENGVLSGKSDTFMANIKPSLTDINFGLTYYL